MQRTEPDILESARRPANPVLLPQVLQQRHTAVCVFPHRGSRSSSPPEPSLERLLLRFPGKDGGRADFFTRARARGSSRAEVIQGNGAAFGCARVTTLKPVSHAALTCGTEMKVPAQNSPDPSTSGERWRNRARRSASFSFGAAFSHEQCSLKRRSNAWQRANKL